MSSIACGYIAHQLPVSRNPGGSRISLRSIRATLATLAVQRSAEPPTPAGIAAVAALDHLDLHEAVVGKRGADP